METVRNAGRRVRKMRGGGCGKIDSCKGSLLSDGRLDRADGFATRAGGHFGAVHAVRTCVFRRRLFFSQRYAVLDDARDCGRQHNGSAWNDRGALGADARFLLDSKRVGKVREDRSRLHSAHGIIHDVYRAFVFLYGSGRFELVCGRDHCCGRSARVCAVPHFHAGDSGIYVDAQKLSAADRGESSA